MTREEAIKGLKVLAKDFSGYKPNEEMFDMAIKALEQPECEDAVSRADVDILIEEAQTAWLRGDILLMYPTLKKGLQKVPSVTPSAQRLLEDGTLIVKVPNLSAVHRVIVDEENSQYCKTFYQDGDEDDKPVHDCMTCRHADRMPGIYPCSECNVAYGKQPSKWEEKEVEA